MIKTSTFHVVQWKDIIDENVRFYQPCYQTKFYGETQKVRPLIFDEERILKAPFSKSSIFNDPQFLRIFLNKNEITSYLKSDNVSSAFAIDLQNKNSFLSQTDFELDLNREKVLSDRVSNVNFGISANPLVGIMIDIVYFLMYLTINNFYLYEGGKQRFQSLKYYELLNDIHSTKDIYFFGEDREATTRVMGSKVAYEFLQNECISRLIIKVDIESNPSISKLIINETLPENCLELHIPVDSYFDYKFNLL